MGTVREEVGVRWVRGGCVRAVGKRRGDRGVVQGGSNCPFYYVIMANIPSPPLLPLSSHHLIEIIRDTHFRDAVRLYFMGSLKLRNFLN